MRSEERHFGGFRLREVSGSLAEMTVSHADVAIFVVNWESRSRELLVRGLVSGETCILVRFADWPGDAELVADLVKAAKRCFTNVEFANIASPMNPDAVMSDAEDLARRISKRAVLSCAVDYTSMPKAVVQTLFRQFMTEGLCPVVTWFYLAGAYDSTPVREAEFHQGAAEFFTIRGAEGSGGMSTERIGIIALGADRPLTDAFLRVNSYDETHFVCAVSPTSPELTKKMETQQRWLMAEHGFAETDFLNCKNLSVTDALNAFDTIVRSAPSDAGASIDLFCSGPKSHGIAASALVTVYGHVRLIARKPQSYAQFEVASNGEISVTTVSDFTNPAVARALVREIRERRS